MKLPWYMLSVCACSVTIMICVSLCLLYQLYTILITLNVFYWTASCKESTERIWVLSLALKALLKTLNGGFSEEIGELYSQKFVQCVVYLASQGTQFSRQWLLKDLEVCLMTSIVIMKQKCKWPYCLMKHKEVMKSCIWNHMHACKSWIVV